VFVTALIFVFSALLTFTLAFVAFSVRYVINSFNKQFKEINNKLDTVFKYVDDNRNSMSNHVDKHHTK